MLYSVENATLLLERARDRLKRHDWFSQGQWQSSIHRFPPEPSPTEAVTLHVFRRDWFNEDRQGIHFETWIGEREWKKRSLCVVMHILHTTHVPNTKIKRIAVSKPFVDAIFDTVSSWHGYKFRAGRYGTQPFSRIIPLDLDTLDKSLDVELTRMCLELGPIMDKTLKSVPG